MEEDARTRADVALVEGRRGLDEQVQALESLRARMTGLLGIVGLVFGLRPPPHGIWFGIVLTPVVLLLATLIFVLWPASFPVSVSASKLLTAEWDRPAEEFVRHLAVHLDDTASANEKALERRQCAYILGLFLTAATVVLLLVARR